MKQEYKIALIGALLIGLLDALSSIASRKFGFNYTILAPVAFIIYATFGFWGTKGKTLKAGVIIAAAIGFFDATVGWEISMLLKANTGDIKNDPTIPVWIFTIVFVTGLAALCGLLGGSLAQMIKRKRGVTV